MRSTTKYFTAFHVNILKIVCVCSFVFDFWNVHCIERYHIISYRIICISMKIGWRYFNVLTYILVIHTHKDTQLSHVTSFARLLPFVIHQSTLYTKLDATTDFLQIASKDSLNDYSLTNRMHLIEIFTSEWSNKCSEV